MGPLPPRSLRQIKPVSYDFDDNGFLTMANAVAVAPPKEAITLRPSVSLTTDSGFTLVELVIVIVVLGILSVVAAPKFINLKSDAHRSVLNGVRGAI